MISTFEENFNNANKAKQGMPIGFGTALCWSLGYTTACIAVANNKFSIYDVHDINEGILYALIFVGILSAALVAYASAYAAGSLFEKLRPEDASQKDISSLMCKQKVACAGAVFGSFLGAVPAIFIGKAFFGSSSTSDLVTGLSVMTIALLTGLLIGAGYTIYKNNTLTPTPPEEPDSPTVFSWT